MGRTDLPATNPSYETSTFSVDGVPSSRPVADTTSYRGDGHAKKRSSESIGLGICRWKWFLYFPLMQMVADASDDLRSVSRLEPARAIEVLKRAPRVVCLKNVDKKCPDMNFDRLILMVVNPGRTGIDILTMLHMLWGA